MKGEEGRGIVVYGMTLGFELGRNELTSQIWVNRCQIKGVWPGGWVGRSMMGKPSKVGKWEMLV